MNYRDIAKAQLRVDEGVRTKPYRDTVGKLTIGVGRNLDDVGLSMEEIDLLLENDITTADRTARSLFPTFDKLSEARKAVLVNLAFNLGQQRLAAFKKLRKAIQDEDWTEAAREMGNSLWASQVGARATRLIKQMEIG
jgi:lysozyme